MDKEVAGLAALYAVTELLKWLYERNEVNVCTLSVDDKRKIDDLYDWHRKEDDEGRKLWYFPSYFHTTQDKIVEMLRDISSTQEKTARLLAELEKKIEGLGNGNRN